MNQMPPKVERVVPEDGRAIQPIKYLPEDVARFYADAQRVLDANVPDAAAVALRKTIEAATAHFGYDKGTLVERIERLIADGLVTRSFGEALDEVRKVGNVGAHASDASVDEATARRALMFTSQMLRNLFEIPGELRAPAIEELVKEVRAKAAGPEADRP